VFAAAGLEQSDQKNLAQEVDLFEKKQWWIQLVNATQNTG
jgi:hypothetical protein